jgi:pimeloyl-ACP methyl ester carboxylesterase
MATAHLGNNVSIEYEMTGEGTPLLLVMGLASQLIHWPDEFVEQIAERGFKVIRFDNRDIGLSTKFTSEPAGIGRTLASLASRRLAKSEYLLADMADDAAGLLDHLGIDAAHVVGVSMGGMIAQSIAIGHPRMVLSLTSIMSNTGDRRNGKPAVGVIRRMPGLMGGAPGPDGKLTEELLANAIEVGRLVSGPHFDEAEERAIITRAFERSYTPAGTMRQMMAISASPNRTKALHKVTAPTLVIHGLADRLVQPTGGMATARAIPGSRLLMFPDMGHDLPRNRWDEIIDAITTNAQRARATESTSVR